MTFGNKCIHYIRGGYKIEVNKILIDVKQQNNVRKEKNVKRLLFLTVLCMGIAMFLASPVCAKVTGVCVNCHTMHNSQGGTNMILNTTIDGTSGGAHGGGYPSLTRGSCVGCHTGANDGTNVRPYVYNTSAPTYGSDTLAGGNFFWATLDGAKGHNVKGIPAMSADVDLTAAPGDVFGLGCATSCHATLFTPIGVGGDPLNTGCEGCHLAPKHHAPQQANQGDPALEANGYFRFLSGHMSGSTYGVEGIEDADWQYTEAAGDHNEYLGATNVHTGAGGFTNIQENTMTAYCTGCHGNFHWQLDGNANWIRHPSDAVLPTTGEYSLYTVYDPIAPVARPDLTAIAATGTVVPGTDMVMCLSCHRAHGSPYNDMVRWEYETETVAGGGGASDDTGCFVCHTEKDD